MDWAKQNLETAPDGAVFLADKLTSASGRFGRIWKVYEGQLNITFILKPKNLRNFSTEDLPIRINQLNMAVSLGIYDAINYVINEFGSGIFGPGVPDAVGIKWPNDFIVQNKKVGGLLFHLVWEGEIPVALICGFAINVNNIFDKSDELFDTATSLAFIVGRKVEMRPLYKNLLLLIDNYYKKWIAGNFDEIYKLWRKAQVYLGKSIKIHQKDGTIISGVMVQVLPNGDMLLLDEAGRQKIVSFYMVEQIILS
jgi:BirA family biotin operon repressor/biotin-[acetyl-CoA-carboxylase] ligase